MPKQCVRKITLMPLKSYAFKTLNIASPLYGVGCCAILHALTLTEGRCFTLSSILCDISLTHLTFTWWLSLLYRGDQLIVFILHVTPTLLLRFFSWHCNRCLTYSYPCDKGCLQWQNLAMHMTSLHDFIVNFYHPMRNPHWMYHFYV